MSQGKDIFGYDRNKAVSGVFTPEGSYLKVSGAGASGVSSGGTESNITLVQTWSVMYRQEVQDIVEVGSSKVYWAKGRPIGEGGISRIVSGDKNQILIMPDAYDICKVVQNAQNFSITMFPGKCDEGEAASTGVTLTMDGVIVSQIGFTSNAGDVKFMEDVRWRFATMDVEAVSA